jgi:hypothetical protein
VEAPATTGRTKRGRAQGKAAEEQQATEAEPEASACLPREVAVPRPPATAAETDSDEEPEDDNDDDCTLCGDGSGRLICCSFCPRSFHFDCLGLTVDPPRDAAWACPSKVCKVPSLLTTQSRSASAWGVRVSLKGVSRL